MRMKSSLGTAAVAAAAMCACLAAPRRAWSAETFTSDFRIEDCTFSAVGSNAYFSLDPGDRLVLEGEEDGAEVKLRITALDRTRDIAFTTPRGKRLRVTARVIEERETADGELAEVSFNFFARCQQTGDVFYFGEEVDIYEDGEVVSHEGAWRAGKNGAQPGIVMPATYLLGSRYFQEVAPGLALDRAEHTAMGLTLDLPAGTFRDCVEVTETTPLEPGSRSIKRYCPGVGLASDGNLELTGFRRDGDAEGDAD